MHLKKVRYDFVVETAYDFIIEQGIDTLPVDPFKICDNNGWKYELNYLFAYNGLHKLDDFFNKVINIKDGEVFYSPTTNEYKILYNDKNNVPKRIKWTIAHEIGHIVLGHLDSQNTSLLHSKMNKNEYKIKEKEADCFAGILLAPPIILYGLGATSVESIHNICELSREASTNRLEYINKYYNYNNFKAYEETILSQFNLRNKDKYYCSNCLNEIEDKKYKYCPICGNHKFVYGDGETMKYSEIQLNEKGKALICPVCDNENVVEGDYCQICGSPIVNRCSNTNCNTILQSDARYCPYCGSESVFSNEKYLSYWMNENTKCTDEIFQTQKIDDDMPF